VLNIGCSAGVQDIYRREEGTAGGSMVVFRVLPANAVPMVKAEVDLERHPSHAFTHTVAAGHSTKLQRRCSLGSPAPCISFPSIPTATPRPHPAPRLSSLTTATTTPAPTHVDDCENLDSGGTQDTAQHRRSVEVIDSEVSLSCRRRNGTGARLAPPRRLVLHALALVIHPLRQQLQSSQKSKLAPQPARPLRELLAHLVPAIDAVEQSLRGHLIRWV
jgi:hypothetical protein